MSQVLTVSCKLEVPADSLPDIKATLAAFADACNYAYKVAEAKGTTNKVKLQHLAYREIRRQFGLSSNLAIRAIGRAAKALKAGHQHSFFHARSADYDQRIFRLCDIDWSVSLTLLGGRQRFKMAIGEYQRARLLGTNPTFATLVMRKNGDVFLHVAIDHTPPMISTSNNILGVDLGRRNLASLSTGERFIGADIDAKRDHFHTLRRALQTRGTKGAKRLLRRLSGREKRYMKWVNHTISARITRFAKYHGLTVSLEDLMGIRETARIRKVQRAKHHRWAFHQLRTFLEYKCLRDGVQLVLINPAYTSQTCHRCLRIGSRRADSFTCEHCGYSGHADYNGACMISLLGACVTRPEHSLSCHLA